ASGSPGPAARAGSATAAPAAARGAARGSYRHQVRLAERGFDRRGGRLPEPADRGIAHDLADLSEEGQLLVPWPDPAAGRQPGGQLLLADAADPAWDALPARLVAEELGDPPEGVHEVDGLVEDHDHARPERRARGARRLEGERQVQRLRADEHAGRP